ncbi:MAG: carboxypeptidase regulatory-like domain-containing protein [Vicinamibacterales bacterium]
MRAFLGILALVAVAASGVDAQGDAALTGVVTSQAEGKMEGVLVTARRDGANFDVTVVSDARGTYSFPRSHVAPGRYTLKIRAVGYDLAGPATADVPPGKTTTLDLTLDKAKDVSVQVTSAEWLDTVPGTEEQKAMVQRNIIACTYCHSMERIVKSRHSAEQFLPVIDRMQAYFPDGTVAGTEGRGRARFIGTDSPTHTANDPNWGFSPGVKKTELAAYLATINRHGGRPLPTTFKTLPRPTGKATRVIVTQYDLPRKDTVPHDSDVDSKGNVWYTDQSDYFVGMLDAKTGAIKEWPLPKATTRAFGGGADVQVDRKDRVWFALTTDKGRSQMGLPGYFDPKTETYRHADVQQGDQFLTLAPDGDIISGEFKISVETTKIVDRFPYQEVQKKPGTPPGPHWYYEPAMDSRGNWYMPDFGGSYIARIDAKTKAATWFKTPTAFSQPRRGKMDAQDRFWFGEYTADRIGMLDTKTEKITEYDTRVKWSSLYTVSVPDVKGRVYSSSNTTDRVFRLDPASGEMIAYLMPTRDFDAKQISVDPVSKKVIWMSNVRNARIIKIEPLD